MDRLLAERLRTLLTILNLNKKSNMNKIEQILVLLLFLPVLHVMAEDNNNGLMLDKFNANGSLVEQIRELSPDLRILSVIVSGKDGKFVESF